MKRFITAKKQCPLCLLVQTRLNSAAPSWTHETFSHGVLPSSKPYHGPRLLTESCIWRLISMTVLQCDLLYFFWSCDTSEDGKKWFVCISFVRRKAHMSPSLSQQPAMTALTIQIPISFSPQITAWLKIAGLYFLMIRCEINCYRIK